MAASALADESKSEGIHPLFWVAILSIVALGAACSFAESVFLGFLRKYPVQMTNGWSSGTGMAGVGGSFLYLSLHSAGMKDGNVFLLLIPTIIVYFLTFTFMLAKPQTGATVEDAYDAYAFTPPKPARASLRTPTTRRAAI